MMPDFVNQTATLGASAGADAMLHRLNGILRPALPDLQVETHGRVPAALLLRALLFPSIQTTHCADALRLYGDLSRPPARPEALHFVLRVFQMPFRQVYTALGCTQVRVTHQLCNTEEVNARFNGACTIWYRDGRPPRLPRACLRCGSRARGVPALLEWTSCRGCIRCKEHKEVGPPCSNQSALPRLPQRKALLQRRNRKDRILFAESGLLFDR